MKGRNLSAEKKVRQDVRRNSRNLAMKNEIKTTLKKISAVVKENKTEASILLKKYYSLLDNAAKKNILHKNNAARKKSAVMNLFKNHVNPKSEK